MWQVYLAVFIIVSAWRDGVTELLRSSTSGGAELIKKRLFWWHFTGVALYVIAAIPLVFAVDWWRILLVAPIIRSIFFNPIRNLTCNEPVWYVGHTAHTDQALRRIAGENGAWVLSFVGLVLLILYNCLSWLQ